MKEFARKFYKSYAWQKCRDFVWARDQGLCVDCLKRGLIQPAEEVHHIEELTPENIDNPAVALNPDNLVSLCRDCHKARHHGEDCRRFSVDELGRVEARR